MSIDHLYVLLGKVSIQVLCPFFNWIVFLPGVESVSYLYILDFKPLSEVSLASMFSHMVGSLFILMTNLPSLKYTRLYCGAQKCTKFAFLNLCIP